MDPAEIDATRDVAEGHRPISPLTRLLALLALVALLASAAISSWWILTGQADFGARSPSSGERGENEG